MDILIVDKVAHRIIGIVVLIFDNLICGKSENEGVFFSNFLYDLNICTVHRSESQGAVQHELHVTGTGSLFTCGGNLLGNISSGKDQLCVADTIILDKYNLDLSFDGRIVIYDIPNGIDQFDDRFCTLIACGSFCSKDEGSWVERHIRVLFQTVIQIHDMKNVHKLAFVLMQTFYLNIKNGVRIYINAVMLFDVFCQANFIFVFNLHKFLLCLCIICKLSDLFDLRKVSNPAISGILSYPVSQKRISMKQETTLCNTVRLIVELLRSHLVEVF